MAYYASQQSQLVSKNSTTSHRRTYKNVKVEGLRVQVLKRQKWVYDIQQVGTSYAPAEKSTSLNDHVPALCDSRC